MIIPLDYVLVVIGVFLSDKTGDEEINNFSFCLFLDSFHSHLFTILFDSVLFRFISLHFRVRNLLTVILAVFLS